MASFTFNGTERAHSEGHTLADVVYEDHLNPDDESAPVLYVNGEVVERDEWANRHVSPGDKIEIAVQEQDQGDWAEEQRMDGDAPKK